MRVFRFFCFYRIKKQQCGGKIKRKMALQGKKKGRLMGNKSHVFGFFPKGKKTRLLYQKSGYGEKWEKLKKALFAVPGEIILCVVTYRSEFFPFMTLLYVSCFSLIAVSTNISRPSPHWYFLILLQHFFLEFINKLLDKRAKMCGRAC